MYVYRTLMNRSSTLERTHSFAQEGGNGIVLIAFRSRFILVDSRLRRGERLDMGFY